MWLVCALLFFFCIWSRHRSPRVEESVEWVFRSLSLPHPQGQWVVLPPAFSPMLGGHPAALMLGARGAWGRLAAAFATIKGSYASGGGDSACVGIGLSLLWHRGWGPAVGPMFMTSYFCEKPEARVGPMPVEHCFVKGLALPGVGASGVVLDRCFFFFH
ncbi:hypothetical protein, unlikely [Trypanosoma brucei brucei TREU927]|uniref:Secreted protein n=1 Tax=Trypanosoma brucei brucei (strain 927/4 GUTat10.1) TaxID=185431 RepID=Q38E92_TRYB2|nr:hypothetical protein, unlikely [Trypanosoma brucei brucei TREU927]EAN76878.1 hypothetical protein, unlikely [Trypanosoma brucei brucei TREU927]